MILFYAAIVIFVIGGIYLAIKRARIRRREQCFLDAAFPRKWLKIIKRNVPVAIGIPEALKPRFFWCVKKFLMEKTFEPCGGLKKISDEMAVTVAANASLLFCGNTEEPWKLLRAVLIYPGSFTGTLTKRVGKIVTKSTEINDGESWGVDRVMLSWERILRDIALSGNPQNVIIHEFAHQFDATIFVSAPLELRERWAETAKKEMARFRNGDPRTIIDEYGADNPVEFFAVSAEAFFETPSLLKSAHPDVYSLLTEIYKISPVEW